MWPVVYRGADSQVIQRVRLHSRNPRIQREGLCLYQVSVAYTVLRWSTTRRTRLYLFILKSGGYGTPCLKSGVPVPLLPLLITPMRSLHKIS